VRRSTGRGLLALALAAAGGALGCVSGGARRDAAVTFSSWYYCPSGRITATEMPAPAPADVAGDPERLAIWRRQHEYDGTYVEVEGCGKKDVFTCSGMTGCRKYRP
jgi:hypothetical protein